jgi:hypothetical protein
MSFQGLSKSDWKFYDDAGEEFEVPPLMGDVYSVVLYHEYVAQAEEPPEGEDPEKFTDYLHKFGVDAPDDRTSFITNLVGTQTFALSEGIPMVAKHNIGDYFETDKTYNINLGNPDKILGECFSFHDKVVADTLDSESGTINVNQTQAARAFYEEDHYYWIVDEMTFFSSVPLIDYQEHSKIVEFWWGSREEWTRYHLVSTDCSLLSVAPVGLDSLPKDSPLVLFMEKYSISGDAPQPEPVKNTIKVTPTSKKLKYSTLKKKAQTFTLKATALEEAKTTFKLASVPKKAKKYVTVSAAGRVKVKKGIPKGTYTLKVKVTAARTKNYKKTTETKKIKLTVK